METPLKMVNFALLAKVKMWLRSLRNNRIVCNVGVIAIKSSSRRLLTFLGRSAFIHLFTIFFGELQQALTRKILCLASYHSYHF